MAGRPPGGASCTPWNSTAPVTGTPELPEARQRLQGRLDRYRSLFERAPVAYLVTDRLGVVAEANRHAADLLGTDQRALTGRPLSAFVAGDDRAGFQDRLRRLVDGGAQAWELTLQPGRGGPRPAAVAVEAVPAGRHGVVELGWTLREAETRAGDAPPGRTPDLRSDPRWPRLGPAARTNQIGGVLSASVVLDDQPIGTCNALAYETRHWTEADDGAVRAFAVMLGRLSGSITDARHKTELTAQLQFALTARVLIEQAKGVLMEREGIDAQRALELLRRRARSSERKLAEAARAIIDRC